MSSKWITSLFKSVILTAALASSFASAFTEGTDYMVLEKPIPNADKTLIKVFSYACPFCYKYDKAVTGPVSEKSCRSRHLHTISSGNQRGIW
jgi:thiol:disulfide interchange protein DsbA